MSYINNLGQVRVGVRGWVAQETTSNVTDVDASAFITAAGITDTTQISALNTLVNDLKTYGLWTKIKALYPFVGGSATSHKFNLKDPRDLDAAYRLVFNGGWVHSSTGAKPNGTNGYSDTFVSNNLMNQNNISISTYLGADNLGDPNTTCAIGSWNGSHGSSIYPGGNTTNTLFIINGSFNNIRVNTDNKSRGLYLASKTTSTSFVHVRGNKTNVTFTTSSNITSSFKLSKIGDYNGDYSGQQHRFTSIGDGLTDTEASNFYTSVQKFQTTLGRHVGTPYVSDPDAIAFLNAAGITDGTQAAAINTLVIRMKADGVWTKMRAIYPFVGGSSTSHKFNLKDPRDLDAAYRLVFNGGGTHTSTGYLGNGSNSYARTYMIHNILQQNNTHVSFYNRYNSTNNFNNFIGCIDYPGTMNGIGIYPISQNTFIMLVNSIESFGPHAYTGHTSVNKFWMINRNNSTQEKVFINGVLKVTFSKSSQLGTSKEIYLGSINGYGNAGINEATFATIGDGLTDTDATNLYSAVQAYQTTLGRQTDVPLVSDTDAQSFLNAANITIFQQASAVNKLVIDLKAAGVWSKMKAIYPFVGGSATSHKFNLKDPRDLDSAYRLVFYGGMTHTNLGMVSNYTTSYASTNLTPSTTLSSFYSQHVSVYSQTSTATPANNINSIGEWQDGTRAMIMKVRNLSNVFSWEVGNSGVSVTNNDGRGFYLASTIANNSIKLYKDNTNVATNTSTFSGSLPSQVQPIGKNENKTFSFATIGDGLTDTDATSLYTAVQTYQTSLGRSVNTPVYNNGLVLNLDAGNANSYPGTGTTWFDLASGTNGTLVNGPTYDVNNGGGLIFNGSNQYISSFNNTNLNFTSSDKFTISCFFKATSTSSYLGLVVSGNTSGEWNYGIWVTNGKIQVGTHNNNRVGNSTIVAGQIYQATLTYSNNTMKVYLNGINDGTFTSFSLFNGLNQQLSIGRKGSNAEWYFPGTVYNVQIYNRELSATEILNNFNSTRGRFGL